MLKEFKKFISKGNVMEMAVGLIMAVYFGAIIKSLVDHIIMPPIGMLLGNVDFSELKVVLQEAAMNGDVEVPEVAISYGMFLNTIITFVIVAFAIFMVVKGYNKMKANMEKKGGSSCCTSSTYKGRGSINRNKGPFEKVSSSF